ncbi:MAG: hypothetical protein WBA41_22755 [Rivularia sp. (in: cyanobacteria)]
MKKANSAMWVLATVRYLLTFGSYGEGARAIASIFNLSMCFVVAFSFSPEILKKLSEPCI